MVKNDQMSMKERGALTLENPCNEVLFQERSTMAL
jgi:hypothetical protein